MTRDDVTLDDLRRRLNEIDRQLIELVAERKAVSGEVARVKRSTGYPTRDYERERDVILGVRSTASELGVSPASCRGAAPASYPFLIDDAGTGERRRAWRRHGPPRAGYRRWREDGGLVRGVPRLPRVHGRGGGPQWWSRPACHASMTGERLI